jgi:hypothetical protein
MFRRTPLSNYDLGRKAVKALQGLRSARRREDLPAIVGFTQQMDDALDELSARFKAKEIR